MKEYRHEKDTRYPDGIDTGFFVCLRTENAAVPREKSGAERLDSETNAIG